MRGLALALVLVLGYLQYQLWFGPGSLQDVQRLEREIAAQRIQNARLLERNERLRAEVADLRTGRDAVEERARNELGMVRADELFFQVVADDAAAAR